MNTMNAMNAVKAGSMASAQYVQGVSRRYARRPENGPAVMRGAPGACLTFCKDLGCDPATAANPAFAVVLNCLDARPGNLYPAPNTAGAVFIVFVVFIDLQGLIFLAALCKRLLRARHEVPSPGRPYRWFRHLPDSGLYSHCTIQAGCVSQRYARRPENGPAVMPSARGACFADVPYLVSGPATTENLR